MTKIWNKKLSGSLTIEASLVVSTVLVVLALLLQIFFWVHCQVVGNLILAETLEDINYNERKVGELLGENVSDIVARQKKRLNGYFYCGDCSLKAADMLVFSEGSFAKGDGGDGWPGPSGTMIMENFEPEKTIWGYEKLFNNKPGKADEAVGDKGPENREKTGGVSANGSNVQKRNES